MTKADHISSINELSAFEGVFTTAQAARSGITRNALSNACKAGRLERIAQGAYRLVGSQPSQLDELAAAWKLTAATKMSHERIPEASWDGIAVGGTTAASLLGIGDFYLSPYRILSPRRINSRNKAVWLGVRDIGRDDISFIEGLPVTKPERTILDLVLDNEDPSLIADALADAYEKTFDTNRLSKLFIDAFGKGKGEGMADALLSDAGMKDKVE